MIFRPLSKRTARSRTRSTVSPAAAGSRPSVLTGSAPARRSLLPPAETPPKTRVDPVPETVAEQVEPQNGEREREPGDRGPPPRGLKIAAALGDDRPPFGRRPLRSQAEEAQRRGREDRVADVQRNLHGDDGQQVTEQVPGGDPHRPAAGQPGREDELALAERQHLPAGEARVPGPEHDREPADEP